MSNASFIVSKEEFLSNLAIRTQKAVSDSILATNAALKDFRVECLMHEDNTIYEASAAVIDYLNSRSRIALPKVDSQNVMNTGHLKEFMWALYVYVNTEADGGSLFSEANRRLITERAHISYDASFYNSLALFCEGGALHGFNPEHRLAEESLVIAGNPELSSDAISYAWRKIVAPSTQKYPTSRAIDDDSLLRVASDLTATAFSKDTQVLSVNPKKFNSESVITTRDFIIAWGLLTLKQSQIDAIMDAFCAGLVKLGYQSDITNVANYVFFTNLAENLVKYLVQKDNLFLDTAPAKGAVATVAKSGRRIF